jgi:cytochrome P450
VLPNGRTVVQPSFNKKNSALVFEAARILVAQIFRSYDKAETESNTSLVMHNVYLQVRSPKSAAGSQCSSKQTSRMALIIILAAAFDVEEEWKDQRIEREPTAVPSSLDFASCLEIVIGGINAILRDLLPRFLYRLPIPALQRIDAGFNGMDEHLKRMVAERLALQAKGEERSDLLDVMVASMGEAGGLSLDEVTGNAFIFALAGHESSANALAFALAYLALDPAEQELVFQDVQQATDNGLHFVR